MPSTSDALRAKWEDPDIPERKAYEFLTAAGWRQGRDWCWRRSIDDEREPTDEENSAMLYLIQEWDEGGWTTEAEPLHGQVFGALGVLPRPRAQTGAPWAEF